MNQKKVYPIVLQFFIIACISFDVYILFFSEAMYKFYAFVMFFVLLNSLTNSIGNYNLSEYNDVYCILDMIEYASFAIMLFSIFAQNTAVFWFLSFVVQVLYIPWNYIYVKTSALSQYSIRKIKQYSVLDGISAAVSLVVFILRSINIISEWYLLAGFLSWIIVLGMWAVDNFSLGSKLELPGNKIMLYDANTDSWKRVKGIAVDSKGCISEIQYGETMAVPDSGTEYYMLPGLIDTHVHIDQNPYQTATSGALTENEVALINAKESAEAGVTTVCDMGGAQLDNYYIVQKLIKSNNSISHIETAGCFFSKRYGHYMQHGGFVIESEQDAELYANYLTKLGIKYAKFMLGNYEIGERDLEHMIETRIITDSRLKGIVDELFPADEEFVKEKSEEKFLLCLNRLNSVSVYTLEELKKIVPVFRKRDIDIFAHAFVEADVHTAIDAGITKIEHPGKYSDELIEKMLNNNVIVTSSYVAAEDGAVLSSELDKISIGCSSELIENWYYDTREVLPKLYSKGVKVALGTDAGFSGTPFGSLVREAISLVNDLGIPARKVIKSATVIAAEKLNMDSFHKIGEVCPKSYADFVLYEANFIDDINTLLHPSQVWIRGEKVYERQYD